MASLTTRLTYADLRQIPPDRNRYELIEGELFVTAAPNTEHQRKVGRLYRLLADYVDKNGLGEVFIAPFDVVLAPGTILEPDIVFVSKGRRSIIREACIEGAPDLLVEVISDSTRVVDRFVKRDRYAEHGVPEYWLLDPFELRLEILRLEGGKYKLAGVFVLGDTVDSPALPGLQLALASL